MTTATASDHQVTDLQLKYLNALSDGRKLGKQMRRRLRRWGVRRSNGAFYRVIQRLKRDGLVKSEHVRKSDEDYRGHEYYYELTDAGSRLVGPKLALRKRGAAIVVNETLRKLANRVRACFG